MLFYENSRVLPAILLAIIFLSLSYEKAYLTLFILSNFLITNDLFSFLNQIETSAPPTPNDSNTDLSIIKLKKTNKPSSLYTIFFSFIYVTNFVMSVSYMVSPTSILYLIFIQQMSDICQYIVGSKKLLGAILGTPHKIGFISPNKTYEGYIFTLVFLPILLEIVENIVIFKGVIVPLGEITSYKYQLYRSIETLGNGYFIKMKIISLGMMSGLIFSAFKRYYEVKNFSTLLGGHGGWLDRSDSVYGSYVLLLILRMIKM